MDLIKIRKYEPDDHKDVSRIFGAGMSDMQTIKNGIAIGRKSPYVIGYLTIIFLLGSFYSLFYGFIALTIGLSFHAFNVYFFFNFYTWYVYCILDHLAPKGQEISEDFFLSSNIPKNISALDWFNKNNLLRIM